MCKMLELRHVVVDGETEESLKEGASRVVLEVRPEWRTHQLLYKVGAVMWVRCYVDGAAGMVLWGR